MRDESIAGLTFREVFIVRCCLVQQCGRGKRTSDENAGVDDGGETGGWDWCGSCTK